MTNSDKGVHPIYWVGGSKGGVGKSMMTIATVDYLLERGKKVLLVECDTSNPDVGNAYQDELRVSSSNSMKPMAGSPSRASAVRKGTGGA